MSTEILGYHPKGVVSSSDGLNSSFFDNSSTLGDNFSSTMSPVALSLLQNGTMSECKNPEHKMLTQSDYVDLLWTTLAEFPGLF